MGRRRQSREIALQALYIADTSGTPQEEAFKIVNRREEAPDPKTLDFALELVTGTKLHLAELDKLIEGAAQNWALSRMAAVDRNVLRLSAFELIHRPETPVNVVIDEAIEIVRKFSTEDSTRFINGILDKLKEHRQGHERPQERRG